MAQGELRFQYEEERRESGMTAFGGLPVFLDLEQVMKVSGVEQKPCGGWQGRAGLDRCSNGECVDNLRVMEGDEGGPGRGPVALREIWAKCGLVVDYGCKKKGLT
jgi:hypothetical protein